ncbi:MAG: nuclear transport factor 2 family protein [Polyangiales bacterium]
MHPHAALIERFYKAFQAKDAEAMAACYAPDARFSDPVFTDLQGPLPGDMWRMLCARGKDLRVEFRDVEADDTTGRAHWEAWYTFSQTGKKVHNVIDARFTFRDGRIATHHDTFDLRAWMAQAMGVTGVLLGWLPPVQNALRRKAREGLDQWRAKRA